MARDLDDNSEQDDADQAQDVAEDALERAEDLAEETERGGRINPAQVAPEDEPDLVERMNGMVASGIIDNDAYAGEPQMDDEEDRLGNTEDDDDSIDDLSIIP